MHILPPRTRCPDKRRLGVKESSRPQSAHARQPARWFAQAHAARDSLQPPLLPRHREHTPRTRPAARRGERFCRTSDCRSHASCKAVGPGGMQPPLTRQVVIILRFLLHSIDLPVDPMTSSTHSRDGHGAEQTPPRQPPPRGAATAIPGESTGSLVHRAVRGGACQLAFSRLPRRPSAIPHRVLLVLVVLTRQGASAESHAGPVPTGAACRFQVCARASATTRLCARL